MQQRQGIREKNERLDEDQISKVKILANVGTKIPNATLRLLI